MKRLLMLLIICLAMACSISSAARVTSIDFANDPTGTRIYTTTDTGNCILNFSDGAHPSGMTLGDMEGGVADHGSLTGLTDNDHPQYLYRDTTTTLQVTSAPIQFNGSQFIVSGPTTYTITATTQTIFGNAITYRDIGGEAFLQLLTSGTQELVGVIDRLHFSTDTEIYIRKADGSDDLVFYDPVLGVETTLSSLASGGLWESYGGGAYYRLTNVTGVRFTSAGVAQFPKYVQIDWDGSGGTDDRIYFGPTTNTDYFDWNNDDSILTFSKSFGVEEDFETSGAVTMNDMAEAAHLSSKVYIGADDATNDQLYIGGGGMLQWYETGSKTYFRTYSGVLLTTPPPSDFISLSTTALDLDSSGEISFTNSTGTYTLDQIVKASAASIWTEDSPKIYWQKTSLWSSGNIHTSGTITAPTGTFTTNVAATNGAGGDAVTISHDGTDAQFKTADGSFTFQTDEGTDTNTYLDIKGKGTGLAYARIYDEDEAEWLEIDATAGYVVLTSAGSTPHGFLIQRAGNVGVNFFDSCASGKTAELKIYGYRASDSKRSLEIGTGVDAADTASFDGLSYYRFDGSVEGAYFQSDGREYLAKDIVRHTVTAGESGASACTATWDITSAAKVCAITAVIATATIVTPIAQADLEWDDATNQLAAAAPMAEGDVVTWTIIYEK